MHMEAKVCIYCTFRKEEKRNCVAHVLAAYMGTVVCACFALICLSLVVQVEEGRYKARIHLVS